MDCPKMKERTLWGPLLDNKADTSRNGLNDIKLHVRTNSYHQQRVCSYLGLKCTHRLSILSLPPNVRQQIYEETEMIRECDVDLGRLLCIESRDCETNLEDTFSLLQTSRTIYAEVLPYVYSTNRFFIRYRSQRSLQPLRNLSPNALASLRHLTIHLNVTSCEVDRMCCNVRGGCQQTCNHDKPLDLSTKRGKRIFDEWSFTATYIFAHIHSSTLNFHLVCDVSTLEAAQLILAPLSTVQSLAGCAIRLARKPDAILQNLARDTATTLTAPDSQADAAPAFPFLLLPRELRKHILSFTDLVSPLLEVQYSTTRAYHLHYSSWYCGNEYCDPDIHHVCDLRSCWHRANGKIGCYCGNSHAAFWTECRCWRPPTPIFLVSMEMRDLAREVFFAKNRFIMVPEDWVRSVVDRLPEQIHAEKFLREVVPRDAMKFVRTLELVFPPFDTPSTSPFKEWEDTLKAVRENLNCPKMTIRVCFADKMPYDAPWKQGKWFRRTMTKKEAIQIYGSYIRIIKPLEQLEGLGRLFVRAAWPWHWTERGQWRISEEREKVMSDVRYMEKKLEGIVMGDDYDSWRVGKAEMKPSQWMDNGGYG